MAEQKPFSAYLAEARAAQGVSAPGRAGTAFKSVALPETTTGAGARVQDPLSWMIDILSRTVRVPQNIVNQGFNEIIKSTQAQKTGTPFDVMGAIGNIATAGPRGFFSTDKNDQPTGQELIEKGTDAFGGLNNPDYVDTKDNVNPWVKGIGGFGLDVGLDPLTYLTFGASGIGRGLLTAGSKAVKDGLRATDGLVAGSKVGDAFGATARQEARAVVSPSAGNSFSRAAEVALPVSDEAAQIGLSRILAKRPVDTTLPAFRVPDELRTSNTTSDLLPSDLKYMQLSEAKAAKKVLSAEDESFVKSYRNKMNAAMRRDEKARLAEISAVNDANRVITGTPIAQALPGTLGEALAATNIAKNISNVTKLMAPSVVAKVAPKTYSAWIAGLGDAAKADPSSTVLKFAGTAGDGGIPALDITGAQLISFSRMPRGPLREAQASILKRVFDATKAGSATVKAAENVSMMDSLKELLSVPSTAEAISTVLGKSAVSYAGKLPNDKLIKATDYLGSVLRGETNLDSLTKWRTTPEHQLTRRVLERYEIDVPGINAMRLQGDSLVGTVEVAEMAVAHAAKKTLADVPHLGGFTPEQIASVESWMPGYLKDNLLSLGGVTRDTTHVLSQVDQYRMYLKAVERIIKKIDGVNADTNIIAGAKRASDIRGEGFKELELALRKFDSDGYSIVLGTGDNVIGLNLHQVLTTLSTTARGDGSHALNIALLNAETSIPLTNMLDAVVAVQRTPNVTDVELLAILKKVIRDTEGNKVFNFVNTRASGRWQHYPNGKPADIQSRENIKDGVLKGYYGLVKPSVVGNDIIKLIRATAPTIAKIVEDNALMAGQRLIAETKDVAVEGMAKLLDNAANPVTGTGDAMRSIANIGKDMAEKGSAGHTTVDAQANATKLLADYLPNDVIHDAQVVERIVSTVKRADSPKLAPAARDAAVRDALKKASLEEDAYYAKYANELVAARKSLDDGYDEAGNVVDEVANIQAQFEATVNLSIASKNISKFRTLFVNTAGKEKVTPLAQIGAAQLSKGLDNYREYLNVVAREFPRELVLQGLRDIANNVDSAATAAVRAKLVPAVMEVFGSATDPSIQGLFKRAGGSVLDLEDYTSRSGYANLIDMDVAAKLADELGISQLDAALTQWRSAVNTVEDPLEFLSSMHYAASLMSSHKSIANSFTLVPGMVSDTAKAGFTKIPSDLSPLDHPFMAHLPKDAHINDSFLGEIKLMEDTIMASRSMNSDVGKWMNNNYLPLLGAWKKSVTIYRPGHHTRNLFSSSSIQYVSEGTSFLAASISPAFKVLMVRRAYKGVDWAPTIEDLKFTRSPKGDDVALNYGGESITVDRFFESAHKNNLFADFRTIESLFDDTGSVGKVSRLVDALTIKKVEKFAGGISEYQSDLSRILHMMQIAMKAGKKASKRGKKVSFDDMMAEAAIKVRRHHPDGSMLTNFEAKYLRPTIPFYSWFRLVMPVIAEGIVNNPGRFMIYPKASYALAVSMGVDPYSMADPFPVDQLFPSFIDDKLTGPVLNAGGNYYTMSPGFAYADMLNQFVADPKQGALGMLTPFAKVPGELITGTRWDTGVSIADFSDYVDANIPGINYVSNFTGTSVSGSIASTLQGKGLDRQYSVDKGNKTPGDQGVSLSNWFTGLGAQNVSKPNYIKYAEFELKKRLKLEQETKDGTARNAF